MAVQFSEEAEMLRQPRLYMLGSAAVDLEAMSEAVNGAEAFAPRFEEPQEKTREVPAVRPRPLRNAFAAVGTVLAASMAALVLLSSASLTRLGAENTALRNRYAAAREESRQLAVEMEASFNRNELALYAAETLGMARPTAAQIRELPDYTEDRVELLDPSLGKNPGLEALRETVSILLDTIR